MIRDRYTECTFLIPVCGDADLSDGKPHTIEDWDWLNTTMFSLFGDGTRAPGLYEGFYTDPDTGDRVEDRSRKYILAVPVRQLDEVRDFLRDACLVFQQKCIYLSIAGDVEFVEHPWI